MSLSEYDLQYQRTWRKRNPDKTKEYYQKNQEQIREQAKKHWTTKGFFKRIELKYGLSYEEYEGMYLKQKGQCAICSKRIHIQVSNKRDPERAFIDHCHNTGKVRGLLCSLCNTGLGMFKDNEQSLKKALKYLKQTKEMDNAK